MSALPIHQPVKRHAMGLPEPRVPINIRAATPDDLAFIDDLQKQHAKMLGFMFRKSLETNIANGDVLIAETAELDGGTGVPPVRLGYIIGRDRYFKREDVGIIYQLAVVPGSRRSLIAAMLVQAMFEKSAYGCKLFCCWCAQDLDANYFWESIGFVPLAFRTGSSAPGRERIHIFWQKRIRAGDTETPYWFPSQTSGGAIRENRLAIPIPPGTHWSDAKPLLLPEIPGVERFVEGDPHPSPLPPPDNGEGARRKRCRRKVKQTTTEKQSSRKGGLWFPPPEAAREESASKKARARKIRVKRKYHPKYVAAARELCARYLEEVQAGRFLPEASAGGGKYDVSRQLMHTGETPVPPVPPEAPELPEPPAQRPLLDAA